jgi:hypothetical protein
VIQSDFNRTKITSDFGFLLLREIDELFTIIDPKKDCLADLRSVTHTNDHFLTETTKDGKWLVLVGRPSLAVYRWRARRSAPSSYFHKAFLSPDGSSKGQPDCRRLRRLPRCRLSTDRSCSQAGDWQRSSDWGSRSRLSRLENDILGIRRKIAQMLYYQWVRGASQD